MKTFLSESIADYTSYTFNYSVYAVREAGDRLDDIYGKGFLPYSAQTNIESEVFYLARSLRVEVSEFADTSENRRVNRLVTTLGLQLDVIPKAEFNLEDPDFQAFCLDYIQERIGDEQMSEARWRYILSWDLGTHIFRFTLPDGRLAGFVLVAMDEDIIHYWFAFFDTGYMRSHSLGKWMMWRVIAWAKEHKRKYVYLGTAYKPSALYKIRDHKGLRFFDGHTWNADMKSLKSYCEQDETPLPMDRFKLMEQPQDFLNQLVYEKNQ